MIPSAALMRASRPLVRQALRRPLPQGRPRHHDLRLRSRWSTSASGAAQSGWFKRMWESEVGIKTVHFWAPVMKWALVLAGVSDFARPAEKLSFTQNFALTCTGIIWTRWCLIIKPKNYLLAAVNFFLGMVGIVQLSRIAMHESSSNKSVVEAAKDQVKS